MRGIGLFYPKIESKSPLVLVQVANVLVSGEQVLIDGDTPSENWLSLWYLSQKLLSNTTNWLALSLSEYVWLLTLVFHQME